ncbi:MAG: S49 family peptidase, partial [Candidatus Paceibacterota bacterium]
MPNWHEIGEELKQAGSTFDVIRRRYLKDLSVKTGRNVILYYSGWLQKNNIDGLQVNDADKNGLMT